MEKRLFLIDGNSLINRAFYALPPLKTAQGVPTNGVYGFMMMLFRLMDDYNPDRIYVAFDVSAPTFRHEQYNEYKANRTGMPDDLRPQMSILKEVLDALGISRLERPGFEADDVIGSAAKLGEKAGFDVYIVTGDRDALQLITPQTRVILTKKGITETAVVDEENLKEEYHVTPEQVKDLKGLMGDSSDNIPGVPGVGQKTALKLLNDYPSMEEIYANLEHIRGKLKEKLETYHDQAFLSKDLATIRCDIPLDLNFAKTSERDNGKLRELFIRLEFQRFLERLPQTETEEAEQPASTRTPEFMVVSGDNVDVFLSALGEEHEISVITDLEQDRLAILAGSTVWIVELEKNADARGKIGELLRKADRVLCDSTKGLQRILEIEERPISVDVDLELAGYCLNSMARQDINTLAIRFGQSTIEHKPDSAEYLAAYAGLLKTISPLVEEELKKEELWELYHDIEIPLAYVLAKMEHAGILVDPDKLRHISKELEKTMDRLTAKIFAESGEEFNINSPKQLGVILFEKLGLPVLKRTKTGPSTSAEVLEKLTAYPIVNYILEYRQIAKLKSTYADALVELISPQTNRIHSTFNQTVTATGRLSSTNPNLQNIPVRSEEGRRIREAFVAPEGSLLLSADYSQIELRVLAHISGDPTLIKAFCSGKDIHTQTASEVFGVPLEEVSSEQRTAAKAINFGIVYGISSFGLAKGINLTRTEAQAYIDQYFARYPRVKEYMDGAVKQGEQLGYVTTLFNRRRYLPDIKSRNYTARSFAARMAMNSPIQGSAADIIKAAMIDVERALQDQEFSSRILLQVHDELVLEVPESELQRVAALVKEKMENVLQLDVPLIVDVNVGHNWRDVKPFHSEVE